MSSRRPRQKGREYNPNIKVAGRRPMMHPTRGETTKYGTDCGQPGMEQRRRAYQELGNEEDDGMSFANRASLGSDGDMGGGRARRGHNGETLGGTVRNGSGGDMGDRDGEPRSGEGGSGEIRVDGVEHHRGGGGDGGEAETGLETGGRGQGQGGCVLGGGAQKHGGDSGIESPGGRAAESASAATRVNDSVIFEGSGRGDEFEGDINMRRQPGGPIRPEGHEHDDGSQASEASYVDHRGRYIASSTPARSVYSNQRYAVVAYDAPASAGPSNPFYNPRAHSGPDNPPRPISTKPPHTSLRTTIDIKTYAYPDLLNAMAGYLHCPPSDVVFDVRGARRIPDFSIAAFMREFAEEAIGTTVENLVIVQRDALRKNVDMMTLKDARIHYLETLLRVNNILE